MAECINSAIHVAIIRHVDDGYDYIYQWIDNGCYVRKTNRCKFNKVSFADFRTIVNWKNDPNNRWIMPGMLYERQFNKMDGHTYTFKMRKDMAEIASKYDLFNDD